MPVRTNREAAGGSTISALLRRGGGYMMCEPTGKREGVQAVSYDGLKEDTRLSSENNLFSSGESVCGTTTRTWA